MELKYTVKDSLAACNYEFARQELYTLITEQSSEAQLTAFNELLADSKQKDDAQRLSFIGESLLRVGQLYRRKHVIIDFSSRDQAASPCPLGMLPIGHWLQTCLARVYLIAEAIAQSYDHPERFKALYKLYDICDTDGRVACLRALNFMHGVIQDGLNMVHDAGRTYLSELMEAAWCKHLFSSTHMSAEEFRKAVLKALFCEVSIEDFLNIDRAADQELSRRLCEFANEREAAERTVPLAVWRVAAYYPIEGLVARLIGRLEHPNREDRLTAAISLLRAEDPKALAFIQSRLKRENDPEIRSVLTQASLQMA